SNWVIWKLGNLKALTPSSSPFASRPSAERPVVSLPATVSQSFHSSKYLANQMFKPREPPRQPLPQQFQSARPLPLKIVPGMRHHSLRLPGVPHPEKPFPEHPVSVL